MPSSSDNADKPSSPETRGSGASAREGSGGSDGSNNVVRGTPGRAPDPLLGRVVADRYRIVGHVGRGGMGVVYRVEHLRIGKLMAMKLLTGELSRNRDVVRRFKREALAASRLTSINTVQVWDFGHSDGLTYLVMELIAGEDFGKVLKATGPMSFARAAQIAVQVCNSMIEAHQRGIVHRDIKPENILILHPEGNKLQDLVKVLDFGLAKLHEDASRVGAGNANEITTTGAIVGTPYYMAPEQIRGEAVDGRTDLYALGAVLYRAVTGFPPFTAPTPMAVLTQHLTEPLVPAHERAPQQAIPLEASAIISKCLAKDRDHRYASAIELREALIDHLIKTGMSGGFLRTGSLDAAAAAAVQQAAEHAGELTADGQNTPIEMTSSEIPATRSEVTAYGRSLKRKAMIAAIGTLAIACLVLWLFRSLRHATMPTVVPPVAAQGSVPEESEPNNDLATATPITIGTPVRGYLGKRQTPEIGDADYYAVDVPGLAGEHVLLDVALAPLPNIPMCLEISRDGRAPLSVFCRKRGRPIKIPAYAVSPGHYVILVTQDRTPDESGDAPPVYENVSDTYVLRVAIAATTPDLEVEPNDTLATAQIVTAGATLNAQLGWRNDEDVYCAAKGVGNARFVIHDRGPMGRPDSIRFEIENFVAGVGAGKVFIAEPTRGPAPAVPTAPSASVDKPDKAAAIGVWTGTSFPLADDGRCIAVRLRPAGAQTAVDQTYQITLEKL